MYGHLSFESEEQKKAKKLISSFLEDNVSQTENIPFKPLLIKAFKKSSLEPGEDLSIPTGYRHSAYTFTSKSGKYWLRVHITRKFPTVDIDQVNILLEDASGERPYTILRLNLPTYPSHSSIMNIFKTLRELGALDQSFDIDT